MYDTRNRFTYNQRNKRRGLAAIAPPSSIDPNTLNPTWYFEGGTNIGVDGFGRTFWREKISNSTWYIYDAGGGPVIQDYTEQLNGITIINTDKFWAGVDQNLWLADVITYDFSLLFGVNNWSYFTLVQPLHKTVSSGVIASETCNIQNGSSNVRFVVRYTDTQIWCDLLDNVNNIPRATINVNVNVNDYIFIVVTYNDTTKTLNLYAYGLTDQQSNPLFSLPSFASCRRPSFDGFKTTYTGIANNLPIRGRQLEHCVLPVTLTVNQINGITRYFMAKYNITLPLY